LAHHGHHHWIFRNGIWIDDFGDDADNTPGYVAPAAAAAPGPCTCLTKTYTTAGLVVFADVCTREAASARVDGTASNDTQTPAVQDKSSNAPPPPPVEEKSSNPPPAPPADGKAASATQAPTSSNYAGRTYADYLAANPPTKN
jgi:hypothetical protein